MSTGINEATLRRLQERMRHEGYKEPTEDGSTMSNNDDPAENPAQPEPTTTTIYTNNEQTPKPAQTPAQTDDERYLARQAELLAQYQAAQSPQVDDLAEQLQQTHVNAAEGSSSSLSGDEHELWQCDNCGYESPLMHRFCGLCGTCQPENWFCDCGYENSYYHRFCGMCGRSEEQEQLGYEDMGLSAQEETQIETSAARIGTGPATAKTKAATKTTTATGTTAPLTHITTQCDPDDGFSFADDSSQGIEQAKQPPSNNNNAQEEFTGWCCATCTYANDNPLFMCCEMCGSARPPSPGAPDEKESLLAQLKQADDDSDTSSKKKERTVNDAFRRYEQQQQQQHQDSLPEPETDHELALIYAQQERILAQYQQQQGL